MSEILYNITSFRVLKMLWKPYVYIYLNVEIVLIYIFILKIDQQTTKDFTPTKNYHRNLLPLVLLSLVESWVIFFSCLSNNFNVWVHFHYSLSVFLGRRQLSTYSSPNSKQILTAITKQTQGAFSR